MKHLLIIFSLALLSLSCDNNAPECGDCGGGILDGFIYQTVTLEDIAPLADINIATDVGACIRAQLDEEGFTEATIVDDCCCSQYE
ncbi:MAG: hypothetical protein ISR83_04475 [Candidatus Marinimicrobia bacterium]|nr:hypothetical protein [Candidatus Neomarinimicrobiota bacterium]